MWQRIEHAWHSGDKIADFTVVAAAGAGGCGDLLLVRDVTGKLLALKLLKTVAGEASQREFDGIVTLRKLSRGVGVAQVFHAGYTTDGRFYYTMEAADNLAKFPEYYPDTLEHRLERFGAFAPLDCIRLAEKLLDGIETLHRSGLTHRDIKPANIIFINGEPLLADFGLVAEQNRGDTLAGTLGFIPPEEIRHGLSGGSSPENDFYALGKVIYCAWTNLAPSEYPKIPASFSLGELAVMRKLYGRACHEKAFRRFRTVADFRRVLGLARREMEQPATRGWRRRLWYGAAASGGLLVVVLGAVLWFHWTTLCEGGGGTAAVVSANAGSLAVVADERGRTYTRGEVEQFLVEPPYRNQREKQILLRACDSQSAEVGEYVAAELRKNAAVFAALDLPSAPEIFRRQNEIEAEYSAYFERLATASPYCRIRRIIFGVDTLSQRRSAVRLALAKWAEPVPIGAYLELRERLWRAFDEITGAKR